jgi:hypothetical protein
MFYERTSLCFAILMARSRPASKLVADLGIKAHAYMLRHARGYKIAMATTPIQAYLGHRNIQNTTLYGLGPGEVQGVLPRLTQRARRHENPGRRGRDRPTCDARPSS